MAFVKAFNKAIIVYVVYPIVNNNQKTALQLAGGLIIPFRFYLRAHHRAELIAIDQHPFSRNLSAQRFLHQGDDFRFHGGGEFAYRISCRPHIAFIEIGGIVETEG